MTSRDPHRGRRRAVRYDREEVRARLLAAIGREDQRSDDELYDEVRAVIEAGKENPEAAPEIVDLFLDRLHAESASDEMAKVMALPSARRGLGILVAMGIATVLLAVSIQARLGPIGMLAIVALIILFAGGMSWLGTWYDEVRCIRQEESWVREPGPLVVVRTYTNDSVFARDASRMRVLGYVMTMQQRVRGANKVTYELREM